MLTGLHQGIDRNLSSALRQDAHSSEARGLYPRVHRENRPFLFAHTRCHYQLNFDPPPRTTSTIAIVHGQRGVSGMHHYE
jgi:hypothetical protein